LTGLRRKEKSSSSAHRPPHGLASAKTPKATIGVLVVQHYENENAYDTDMEFLSSVGGHIALAIERRRAEDALRKMKNVRLLFSNNPLPTWVLDRETLRFLEVNDAATAVRVFTR